MADQLPDMTRLADFVPFDSLSQSHLEKIQAQIQVQQLPAGRLLFKRGQHSEQATFLITGRLDLTDSQFQIHPFSADDDENYLALDNYPQHTVNAITAEPCILYSIDRDKLDLLMTWTQASESMLSHGDADSDRDWMDALLASELFSAVPPTMIHRLFMGFTPREVQLGETIINEGDSGDIFYVLKEGKAMVSRQQGNRTEVLATLAAGRFFGEDALISDAPRNATVTMTSDGVLMCLAKDAFQAILQDCVIRHLSEAELEQLEQEGDNACVLLDVRLPMEFRHDRTPGAKNLPLNEIRRSLHTLEKAFTYVVCGEGRRSELAAYILSEAGLTAYVLDRGSSDNDSSSNDSIQAQA